MTNLYKVTTKQKFIKMNSRLKKISLAVLISAIAVLGVSAGTVNLASAQSNHGTLYGHATYGPTCPGPSTQNATSCYKPLANAHFNVTNYIPPGSLQPTQLLTTFYTDQNGDYRVKVPLQRDGRLVTLSLADSRYNFPTNNNRKVQVYAGQKTMFNMFFDTGIR